MLGQISVEITEIRGEYTNGKYVFTLNTVDDAIEAVRQINTIDRKYCRRYIEQHFTVNQMAEKYIRVYETVLNKQ